MSKIKNINEKIRSLEYWADKSSKDIENLQNKNKELSTIDECRRLRQNIESDIQLMREYNKALAFLNWFDFSRLASQKLAQEVFDKKWEDLTISKTFNSYSYLFPEEVKITNTYINDTTIQLGSIGESPYSKSFSCCSNLDNNVYDSIQINDVNIKLNKKQEKIKYEEKIGCVCEKPFNYDESVVIAVYEYLKDILNKNKLILKYRDK